MGSRGIIIQPKVPLDTFLSKRRYQGFFHASVIREYLILLGIKQTCRFQEKSFLKFLLSGEQDVDKFKSSSKNTLVRFPDELAPSWKKTSEIRQVF